MSDDHFVIIRIAQRWLDGYSDWFNKDHPSGFSLVYPGLHYILFYLLKLVGITDPQIKMFIVRFLHGTYSLLIVYFGYQIALNMGDKKTAKHTGIFLALYWLLPFMSVRNLVEVVCIPPMMIGFYLGLKSEEEKRLKLWILAGFLFGITFAIRYQTLLITGGIGLVLLFQKRWQPFTYYSLGVILGLFLLQGVVDIIAWGYPFAAFVQYTAYNVDYRYAYVVGPWYRYLLLITGVLIPPISFYLIFGIFKSWKKHALLFWPVLIFFVFHSYYPNKQERFILPILPFLVILGFLGWNHFMERSQFWLKHQKLLRGTWIWFWMINSILLIALSFTYTKRTMVEPLSYLSQKSDLNALIFEYPNDSMPWFPRLYLDNEVPIYRFYKGADVNKIIDRLLADDHGIPKYIYFYGNDKLESRSEQMEQILESRLAFEKKINPSNIDWLMHALNPRHNKNHTGYIYKLTTKY